MKANQRHQRKRTTYAREINFRDIVQTFLIVCEGLKTEKLYFEAFKVPKDVKDIDVIGRGLNTISLVDEAIRIRDASPNEYDQVWCVFDVEDHNSNEIHQAVALARRNHIKVAISNQCFELWYLLHFHYYHTAVDRRRFIPILTRQLGFQYQKNECVNHHLIDRQPIAIRNAEKLLRQYQPYDPAVNDPSTSVHLLVIELNRFSPESR
jgi:hypothetical protein